MQDLIKQCNATLRQLRGIRRMLKRKM